MKRFLFLIAAVPLAAAPMYTLTGIGGAGGSRSDAFAINAFGVAAGTALDVEQRSHGFAYESFVDDLGTDTEARAINSHGHIAGSNNGYATVWRAGTAEIAAGAGSSALGINDSGQITGSSGQRAFLMSNGALIDLGTLGGAWSAGYGINNSGRIAGSAQTAKGDTHAFAWDAAGGMRDLGTLGGRESRGMAINVSGTVAGAAMNRSRYFHASVWDSSGAITDLGTLGGGHSYAYGLNDAGFAVGWSFDSLGRSRAFVWTGGMLHDLNDLVSNAPGWSLSAAYGINARGQIVGSGTYLGQSASFRLDPVIGQLVPRSNPVVQQPVSLEEAAAVPEPGSLALIAIGALLLSVWWQLRLTELY